MKKELTILLLMLMVGVSNMMAQGTFADLYIPDVNVEEGATSVVLNLCMKNSASAADCFETTIYVPEGFAVTKLVRGSRIKVLDDDDEYVFAFANSNKNGGRYMQCYTVQDAKIQDVDGDVAKVTVSIPADAKAGRYEVVMKEVECGGDGIVRSSYAEIISYITIGDNGEVKLNSYGYATYSSAYERSVPADVMAYTGSVNEGAKTITWTEITDGIIPANEGVLLKGTANANVTLAASSTGKTKIDDNNMKPNLAFRTKSNIGEYVYVLSGSSIVRLSDSGTLAANKAYFNLSKYITDASSAAKSFTLVWEDATGIGAVKASDNKPAYNINGVSVKSNSKGVVIVDGKKQYNK